MLELVNGDCIEVIRKIGKNKIKTMFADIPDNIGVKYTGFDDKINDKSYYDWIRLLLLEGMNKCQLFWLSYNAKHDLEIKYIIRDLLKYWYGSWECDTFIWRYTFSQYQDRDCAYGYRPIVRLKKYNTQLYPGEIREVSKRQLLGDKRGIEERVPDNVWNYPRIVGNSNERRNWHPTQHPQKLMERIIRFSNQKQNDIFMDLFCGSGTSLIVCKDIDFHCVGIEISQYYCEQIINHTSVKMYTTVHLYETGSC